MSELSRASGTMYHTLGSAAGSLTATGPVRASHTVKETGGGRRTASGHSVPADVTAAEDPFL